MPKRSRGNVLSARWTAALDLIMRILVVGAGVIGQVYAGRLGAAGHDVTIVARGATFELLSDRGIHLVTAGATTVHSVGVIQSPSRDDEFDCALLAVRFDQVDSAIDDLAGVDTRQVITFSNMADRSEELRTRLGDNRTVLAFPGVGGSCNDAGQVQYSEVRQQHTTVGRSGSEQQFVQALRDAQFTVDVVDEMPAWLTTHAVFLTTVAAAILAAGGDSRTLGRDRRATAAMVAAVAEGFQALEIRGIRPVPAPLRTIFTQVPKVIAVPYWQRQLRGRMGVHTITPHVVASRDTELPALATAVRRIVGSSAPGLSALLTSAGL